jgi:hypothetical protein
MKEVEGANLPYDPYRAGIRRGLQFASELVQRIEVAD